MKRQSLFLYKTISLACLVLITLEGMARSGGGGGDFSSGDSDSGGIMALIWLIIHLPFPLNVIVLVVILVIAFLARKKYRESSNLNTIQQVKSGFMSDSKKTTMLNQVGDFDERNFLDKASFAFNEVQKAWMKKNLGPVRKFMSDGVYQRFHVQMMMMDKLEQQNLIDHINLKETRIAYVEKEFPYDIIHVQYQAEISEKYVSQKFSRLNQSYKESFIEFWTFIRKKGQQHKDIYHSTQCPNCGDALPEDMGEVSKCNSCGTYINMGEYDWVLCEITQPEEFIGFVNGSGVKSYLVNQLQSYNTAVPGINSQLLEDKASNAYLQIRIAHALNDMNRIRRFSTDTFFEGLQNTPHHPYLFNRIYLRDVSLINVFANETHYFAAFSIMCKEQKVMVDNGDLRMIDQALVAVPAYLALTINRKNKLSAHSVLAHNCTQCGGIVTDTTDIVCPYCGTNLNSDERDWIVCGFFNQAEYENFKQQFAAGAIPRKKEEQLAEIDLKARDFAINNMMVVMMADGNLSDEERSFAVKMAKKLGYNSKKISTLWEHSSANKMGIIMPDEKNLQQKVYKYMKKAAQADNAIGPEEQAILDDVKVKYALQD